MSKLCSYGLYVGHKTKHRMESGHDYGTNERTHHDEIAFVSAPRFSKLLPRESCHCPPLWDQVRRVESPED